MRTILVVDDEPAIRDLIEDVLRDEGHAVRGASDGLAALAEVERDPPDLIVCDLMMPRLDGRSLVARLREAGAGVPVLIVSAAPRAAAGLAVSGVLAKPFDLGDLVTAVERALAGG
ncbi:MAG: hypothetical protein AVDCRST_MAG19-4107 [uncultured Thermomicrobiales bacterium]|uniref:Response regulatory domain-containing protein n=1 Tax=uncultured Thermomicrobiales bacterium TaxID=1645740 RepID=A0A6J4VMV9_9BACT|nr:MAG: hypothetical protein AVDCRST_MAG19-4107 [uncultured Thermomicrobiales bacterium]